MSAAVYVRPTATSGIGLIKFGIQERFIVCCGDVNVDRHSVPLILDTSSYIYIATDCDWFEIYADRKPDNPKLLT